MSSERSHYGRRFFIHIMNRDIQNHIQIEFSVQRYRETTPTTNSGDLSKSGHLFDRFVPLAACKKVTRLPGDIDATKISDGTVSRILCLRDKAKENALRLHAPWSPESPFSISYEALKVFNPFNIAPSPSTSPRAVGKQRTVLDPKPMVELLYPGPNCVFTLRDEDRQMHRVQVLLAPRNEYIAKILDLTLFVLPGWTGDWLLAVWWSRYQACHGVEQKEWNAFVESAFIMALALDERSGRPRKSEVNVSAGTSVASRVSRGSGFDPTLLMQELEGSWPGAKSTSGSAWAWAAEKPDQGKDLNPRSPTNRHILAARDFVKSKAGLECIAPLRANQDLARLALSRLLIALHLYREERKLDVTTHQSAGSLNELLAPVLAQLGRWMEWEGWDWKGGHYFGFEAAGVADYGYEDGKFGLLRKLKVTGLHCHCQWHLAYPLSLTFIF
jgi:anaphase-promoting complex subunit 1